MSDIVFDAMQRPWIDPFEARDALSSGLPPAVIEAAKTARERGHGTFLACPPCDRFGVLLSLRSESAQIGIRLDKFSADQLWRRVISFAKDFGDRAPDMPGKELL